MCVRLFFIFSLAFLLSCGNQQNDTHTPAGDMKVDNFGLFDQNGKFHRLYYYSDAKAIVLYIQGNACPIVRNGLHSFKEVRDEFESEGVKFFMLNANLQDNRVNIVQEATDFKIDLPVLVDEAQLVAEALDITRTAEALLIDPKTWTIVYRGPVDDRMNYEGQKKEAQNEYLSDAIEAVLTGGEIAESVVKSKGCLVSLPNKKNPTPYTFTKDIAPLLQENCQQCHQTGGIAPWAMTSYEVVRGWTPMMREVIRTRRMPPWQADPHVGAFSNDLSLTVEERQKIVHWIEQGAPRGEGEDPLKTNPTEAPSWALGEPDIVFNIAKQEIPATGVLDYRYDMQEVPLDKDAWVRAVDVLPGNRSVLHHVLVSVTYPNGYKTPFESRDPWLDGVFAAYAPGTEPDVFPKGSGRFLPKGSKLTFQLHYTTTGKAEVDQTQLGVYLSEETPENEYFILGPANFELDIKPGVKDYTVYTAQAFDTDVTLYAMFPHMHFRGTSMKYEVVYPDGTKEPVLNVPYYNFNWQRGYRLKEPKVLPAGSQVIVEAIYDNSAQNPFNPDPSITVRWGEQSFDEMMIGYMTVIKGTPEQKRLASK